MASFRAKIRWGSPRKRKNKKKIVPMSSYPTSNREFQKNSKKSEKIKKIVPLSSYKTRNRKFKKKAKKLKKLKKHHNGIISSQNKLGKARKERK